MSFLANGYKQSLVNDLIKHNYSQEQINQIVHETTNLFLVNLKYTLWPLCLFMPMFIWFITRNKIISFGGHTNIVSTIETIAETLQIVWLVIICSVFNKNNTLSFPWVYFIFFLSDVVKFVIYEIVYYKIDWVKNITPNNYNI